MFVLDFPAETPVACEPPGDVRCGCRPGARWRPCAASNHLFVYASEAEIRSLETGHEGPSAPHSREGGRGVIATAPCSSDAGDVVLPVLCASSRHPRRPLSPGSAHCMIVPYWAGHLGTETIHALQVSHPRRRTPLPAETRQGSDIAGQAVAFIKGTALIPS